MKKDGPAEAPVPVGIGQNLLLHMRIAIPLAGGTQCLAPSPEHHAL